MGEPAKQPVDSTLRNWPKVHAYIIALEGAEERLCHAVRLRTADQVRAQDKSNAPGERTCVASGVSAAVIGEPFDWFRNPVHPAVAMLDRGDQRVLNVSAVMPPVVATWPIALLSQQSRANATWSAPSNRIGRHLQDVSFPRASRHRVIGVRRPLKFIQRCQSDADHQVFGAIHGYELGPGYHRPFRFPINIDAMLLAMLAAPKRVGWNASPSPELAYAPLTQGSGEQASWSLPSVAISTSVAPESRAASLVVCAKVLATTRIRAASSIVSRKRGQTPSTGNIAG